MDCNILGRSREFWRPEHQTTTRRGELEKSAIADHAWTENHRPVWDETSILEKAKNYDTMQIKKALCIMMADLLNRDRGITIMDCRGPLLRRMRETSQRRCASSPADSMFILHLCFFVLWSDEDCSMEVETSAFVVEVIMLD